MDCYNEAERVSGEKVWYESPKGGPVCKMCPLMLSGAWVDLVDRLGADDARPMVDCYGPRCAWFDADKSRCAVLSIARNK